MEKVNLSRPEIAVAGHICLDIIPKFPDGRPVPGSLFLPGKLIETGDAVLATGGAVPNTGIALHRLGMNVSLTAKAGDDDFGRIIRGILQRQGAGLADGMIVSPDSGTSYTVVISPPGQDRMFLHFPGANHSFCADDMDFRRLAGVRLFHFGYPTLMRRMYCDGGAQMKTVFDRAHEQGALTSMDMTCVDPASEAGRVDWTAYLKKVLPSVDVFLPSIDELLFMVNRPVYDRLSAVHHDCLMDGITRELVEQSAQTLIGFGVPVVVIKLGDQGLYLRTAGRVPGKGDEWCGISRFMPCFKANVVGTTGAGDCTIAGFLAGFLKGGSPGDVVAGAVGTGAFSTESAEATGSVPHWDVVQARIANGWETLHSKFA